MTGREKPHGPTALLRRYGDGQWHQIGSEEAREMGMQTDFLLMRLRSAASMFGSSLRTQRVPEPGGDRAVRFCLTPSPDLVALRRLIPGLNDPSLLNNPGQ
jgi:hypothetical protein